VAGVERTVCIHSCPLSFMNYLGGRIYPRISSILYVYSVKSYYLGNFYPTTFLPAILTKTGVENFTRDAVCGNIFNESEISYI
jgi:hypothetical protein